MLIGWEGKYLLSALCLKEKYHRVFDNNQGNFGKRTLSLCKQPMTKLAHTNRNGACNCKTIHHKVHGKFGILLNKIRACLFKTNTAIT